MPALQDIFHENAQILPYQDAFYISGKLSDIWNPKQKGVFIPTSEAVIHFPMTQSGLAMEPDDIIVALAEHPILGFAQDEMNRLQSKDFQAIEQKKADFPLLKALERAGQLTLPFFMTVNSGENEDKVLALRLSVKPSAFSHPECVRNVLRGYIGLENAPKISFDDVMAKAKKLPDEIDEMINRISIAP